MTLILTEIYDDGIVMAADRLWTRPLLGRSRPRPKLFNVPYLNAGVSTWGGTPNDCPPQHEWIPTFIDENEDVDSIVDLARRLEDQAISQFGALKKTKGKFTGQPRASLGFHIAGYEENQRVFFNINNNPSQGEPELKKNDRSSVKLEDWRDEAVEKPPTVDGWLIHNGDWEGFRTFFDMFNAYRQGVSIRILNRKQILLEQRADSLDLPDSGQIEDHGKYLGLLIMFTGGVYQLSNMTSIKPSNIGGYANVIMMSTEGTVGEERKTVKMTDEGVVLR